MFNGDSGSDTAFTMKLIVFALGILFLTPVMFTLFVPSNAGSEWEDEINQLENDYYLSGGSVGSTTEVWAMSGIYTPYGVDADGVPTTAYLVTSDGWISSGKIVNYSPSQYNGYSVRLMDNGLYYYTSVPETDLTHTAATYHSDTGTWDYSDASIYTAVTMDNAHKSDVFFTSSSKTTTDDGYYYTYTGYRYSWSPLREYETEADGAQVKIVPNATSINLVWYQYASYSGIAGQLAISGSDNGLSYLNASDIVRAFNANTYSSTFDMTFNNNIKMHIKISLDVDKITNGMSIETAYNSGYWSVMISSDAVASSNVTNSSYEFNIDNIFNTLIDMFTFNIASDYNISGWEATIVSLFVTMPLYAALIAICLKNYYLLIGVAILGILQAGFSIF